MPKKGFRTITIRERTAELLENMKKRIEEKERKTVSYADILELLLQKFKDVIEK